MSRRTRTALGVLAAALLALPAAAEAKKKAPQYDLKITGNQVSTWNQSHMPEFRCDATVTGAGSQDVPITVKKGVRVELVRPKGLPALLAAPGDAGAKYGFAAPLTVDVTATREGYQNIQSPGGDCGGTGGWDGQTIPSDCGPRYGMLELGLGYGSGTGVAVVDQNTRDILRLSGRYTGFEASPFPAGEGDPIGHTFANCPYWPAGTASDVDELVTTGEKLPVAKLAKLKLGKTLKVSGGEVEPEASGDFIGETTIAWNLKLKRVR
jgi:hypothetical protein